MHTDGIWFKDDDGRTLLLRGVNLGGSTKVPYAPNGATHIREGFFDYKDVSFVGRPFPLQEADEHFARLRAWGLTFLRFLVTWEAIEHAGPGQYDTAYLDYVRAVLEKAAEYGISVFIDPHQDVWSRWTGGDGAPAWTLEAVGFDLTRLSAAGAAIVHAVHGDPFPRMIWPTNYNKLATATLFTLFFAGDAFAPQTKVDGVPVQEFLQGHYINAIKQLARRIHDLPNVVGYDTLNEPSAGFIGLTDLSEGSAFMLRVGETPTPFQAMLLGAGYPQTVDVYEMGMGGMGISGTVTVNPDGIPAWRTGYECVWKQNGVWTDEGGAPRLLRPDHFASGQDFANQYFKPFALRYIEAIRSIHPDAIIFIEEALGTAHPHWGAGDPGNVALASHWYDGMTLFSKHFEPEFALDMSAMQPVQGAAAVRQMFVDNLARIKQGASEHMGGIPTLIGEFGIPFDLDEGAAYRNGDFSTHVTALDYNFNAMDVNLLNFTLWNYTADNSNARGDMWNGEDLSLFSRDQLDDPDDIHSGGRGLAGAVRPYARKIAGLPLRMAFDLASRAWTFEFRHDPQVAAPTEIFVPDYQYPNGYTVELSDGTYEIDHAAQTLIVRHSADRAMHTVTLRPA